MRGLLEALVLCALAPSSHQHGRYRTCAVKFKIYVTNIIVIYILYRVKWIIKSRNTILNYATLSRKKLKRKERESG